MGCEGVEGVIPAPNLDDLLRASIPERACAYEYDAKTSIDGGERMKCAACSAPGYKNWNGDDPKCAFETGRFSTENWNCGTVAKLRRLAQDLTASHERGNNVPHPLWANDQNALLLPFYDGFTSTNDDIADFLFVGWYKSRGRTESVRYIGDGFDIVLPNPPTEAEVLQIVTAARRLYKLDDGPIVDAAADPLALPEPSPAARERR